MLTTTPRRQVAPRGLKLSTAATLKTLFVVVDAAGKKNQKQPIGYILKCSVGLQTLFRREAASIINYELSNTINC